MRIAELGQLLRRRRDVSEWEEIAPPEGVVGVLIVRDAEGRARLVESPGLSLAAQHHLLLEAMCATAVGMPQSHLLACQLAIATERDARRIAYLAELQAIADTLEAGRTEGGTDAPPDQ